MAPAISVPNLNANSGVSTNPTFTFSGQAVSGMGLADFLLGKASSFRQGNETVGNGRQNYIGVYVQDTWKASNRLTVNAGLAMGTLPAGMGSSWPDGAFRARRLRQGYSKHRV